jgi:hypothetical protein
MKGDEQTIEMVPGKPADSVFCHRCKIVGHYTKECRRVWMGDREEFQGTCQTGVAGNLSDLVAPLCVTQAEGQNFFCIPDRPSQNNAKERANTAIVTILKGTITTQQLEEEFTRILSGSWRWTTRRVVDNKYTVRFPDVQLLKEWGKFSPVQTRTAKAKIQIDTWNGSIGAKAELQMA